MAGRGPQGTPNAYDWSTMNAHIEAFTIHLRQMIDFFWCEHPRSSDYRDAYAADYFEDGRWDELRPERPAILDQALRRKVGWGVAHLTYDRAWTPPEGKRWPVDDLARALAPRGRLLR